MEKNPTSKIDFFLNSIFLACVTVALLIAGVVGANTGLLSRKFPHLGQAYKDYGFAYCFTLSVFDVGINQPEQYTFDTVESILQEINDLQQP